MADEGKGSTMSLLGLPTGGVPMESALIGCFFAALPCGTSYGFSLYSEAMQKQLDLTPGQLLNITTIPQVFGFLGPLWGMLAVRCGIRVTLVAGGVLGTLALIMQYCIAMQWMSLGPAWLSLMLMGIIQFQGQQATTAIAFPVPVQHYQQRRGKATALVKSFVGLSGACVAQIFWLFVGYRNDFDKTSPDALIGLLLWAGVCAVGTVMALAFIPTHAEPDPAKESDFRLNTLFGFLLSWGVCSIVVSVVHARGLHFVLAVILIVMMVALPGFLFFWRSRGPLVSSGAGEATFESPVQRDCSQMVRTLECWCLFIAAIALISGGIVISNSISDILTAAGNESDDATVLAETLYSTGNMLGRLTCMVPSNALVMRGWPRPTFLISMLLVMSGAHVLFLLLPATSGSELVVAPASFLSGYSFGSIWPHLVVVVSEVFGTRGLSANYMFFDGCTTCISSLVIGRLLVGSVLTAHADAHGVCHGAVCFRLTHYVILGCNVLGVLAVTVLMRKTTPIYRAIHQALTSPALDENNLLTRNEA